MQIAVLEAGLLVIVLLSRDEASIFYFSGVDFMVFAPVVFMVLKKPESSILPKLMVVFVWF